MKAATVEATSSWIINPLFRWSAAIIAAVVAGIVVLELLKIPLFGQIGLPHEYCYLREPRLIWLHVISDLAIGISYVSISATLAVLVYRASKHIPFNGVLLAFGLFIVSCGLTHFMEVWVVWKPVYWLSGYIKVFTGLASAATAVALIPLLPKIFALIEAARKGEQRRVEIEQLNLELERFNYSVAHDLRAPLRGITGLGHALREDYSNQLPPLAQDYIVRMETSAARMNSLITDLLRYASIGTQALTLRPVPLETTITIVCANVDASVRDAQAEIVVQPSLPVVLGDPTLLQSIFQNLIENAIKFVAPSVRPRIEITAQIQPRQATLFVTDNGIGIPPNSREAIFGMFARVSPDYPGTGIGLAIVRRAVERLGGEIGISDRPPGTGTQFWLRFALPQREKSRVASRGKSRLAT